MVAELSPRRGDKEENSLTEKKQLAERNPGNNGDLPEEREESQGEK